MVITICIGSSCHLKGSREIVHKLESLISQQQLGDKVSLTGSFCMGECVKGVCIKVEDDLFSLTPATVDTFFETEVLRRLTE
jgi:NADH:ubiquinone oxidoreductase subunit E